MSRTPNVPADVPGAAPPQAADGGGASGIPYMTRTAEGWRFQMRIPKSLAADSFLATPRTSVRVSLGNLSRRQARRRSRCCSLLCTLVFDMARQELDAQMSKMNSKQDEERLLGQVIDACKQAISRAMASPSEALGIAQGLDSALGTLKLVAAETARGEQGMPHVVQSREALTRDALSGVLALANDPAGARAAMDAVRTIAPSPPSAPATQSAPASPGRAPTFSEVSQAYIDMRSGVDGPDHKEIRYLILRRQTFLELIGDRPVDEYTHKDLQDYIIGMRTWPRNATKRSEMANMSVRQILEDNGDLHLEPLARKTLKGYVAHIRTMLRYRMNDCGYRDPFQGAKPKYPATARPSVIRQEIPADVLQKTFGRGIASGCIDEAIMPALAILCARRIGLLSFLRGSDIREKGGIAVAEMAGIAQINGVWQRLPIKTAESTGFFVLHGFFREIGFVEWATGRGDDWLFPQLHVYADPAKEASRIMNKNLRASGAVGRNVEVFHCLRGDGITDLRRVGEIHDRTARLQSGHVFRDEHDHYGQKSLVAEECVRIARRPLPQGLEWSVFEGLDFEALAKGRRQRGRPRRGA